MPGELMDLDQLARFLGRDKRELGKLANRGALPGRKVGGEWRFHSAEIHHWVEKDLANWTDDLHLALDPACPTAGYSPLISTLIPESCIDLEMTGRSKSSVLRRLLTLADATGHVWNADSIREAVEAREIKGSTAWPGGFATPHPHRRLPDALGESLIVFGRTPSGIPFGAADGQLTDLYFLVCCTDDRLHLRTLSRLARLLAQRVVAEGLRSAAHPHDVRRLLDAAEIELAN